MVGSYGRRGTQLHIPAKYIDITPAEDYGCLYEETIFWWIRLQEELNCRHLRKSETLRPVNVFPLNNLLSFSGLPTYSKGNIMKAYN